MQYLVLATFHWVNWQLTTQMVICSTKMQAELLKLLEVIKHLPYLEILPPAIFQLVD